MKWAQTLLFYGFRHRSLCLSHPSFITIFFLLGASSRLWQIIDKNPTIPFDQGLIPKTGNLKGNISFDNIDFSYPSRPDISVLKNLSLHVPSDHVMAVVGGSGSGKSTLASLLLRLYDPDKVLFELILFLGGKKKMYIFLNILACLLKSCIK